MIEFHEGNDSPFFDNLLSASNSLDTWVIDELEFSYSPSRGSYVKAANRNKCNDVFVVDENIENCVYVNPDFNIDAIIDILKAVNVPVCFSASKGCLVIFQPEFKGV